MEEFDQLENKRILIKNISIISGIVLVSAGFVIFLLFQKKAKTLSIPNTTNISTNGLNLPAEVVKPLYSTDLSTWIDYSWPGKLNTHYPSNWQLIEEKNSNGNISYLEIVPPINNPADIIFIGGTTVNCSSAKILQYSKNACLKNKIIKIPFYTNSQNQEVLSAFDIIFKNTILTIEK